MDRARRAATLGPYFDLQLRFATAVAAAAGVPLDAVVLDYTNLHRRFGLGPPDAANLPVEWDEYATRLGDLADHGQRLAWTQAFFVRCPPEPVALPGQTVFGCFACDPPDAEGAVRIHFTNRDPPGAGPLSAGRFAARQRELTGMLIHLREVHPDAREIRGGSWLYSREAYRRLFPPEYRDSCQPLAAGGYFQGSSRWGQFLDHREALRPELGAAFLGNLAGLDPDRPWAVFPVPRFSAHAPIDVFYDYFRVV